MESAYTHNPLVFDEHEEDLIRDQGTGPSSTSSSAPRRAKAPKDNSTGFGFVYSPMMAGLGYDEGFPSNAAVTSPQSPDLGSITTI